jgi:RNA ligase (TIGR02306 family)
MRAQTQQRGTLSTMSEPTTDVRRLVTLETVTDTRPIDGADVIEVAIVRGWQIVVKKNEFQPGTRCIFFEIDSFLPTSDPRYAFLAPRGTRTVDGVTGHVLRTAKLRGTISQGLIMPASDFPELDALDDTQMNGELASVVGVTKYEPPIPAELAGQAIGPLPTQFAPKTDAARIQNLVETYPTLLAAGNWIATEKIDGTSVTYINDNGRLRVCSRNFELADDGGTQWKLAATHQLLDTLQPGDCVQAELYGEGIQGNPLGIRGQKLAVFSLWRNRRNIPRQHWPAELLELATPQLALHLPASLDEAIQQADKLKSSANPQKLAEGIVWHHADGNTFRELDGRACFKVINNSWLLKQQ